MVSSGLKLSLDNLLTYIDQKGALLDLIGQLKEEFPHATIHGHNEFSAKACPCFDVKKEYSPYFDKGSGGINKAYVSIQRSVRLVIISLPRKPPFPCFYTL